MARKPVKVKAPESALLVRICVERIVPDELNPARAEAARVLESNLTQIDRGATLDPSAVMPSPRMALLNLKKWQTGRVLRCKFLDGSPTQRKRVEAKAHLWEEFANIKFKFVNTGDAEIRISFSADSGSWSALGTDALISLYFPKHQPTMNYGWLKDDTDDQEYMRVVLHEFGHALGCPHEHQSPKAKLKWNEEAVLRVFSGSPNFWDREAIRNNILKKYGSLFVSATAFDLNSIMLYHFPPELFADGKGTPNNTTLSDVDKRMIAQMYPK